MFEVELKAHVYDREEAIKNLNSFAKYERKIIKDDTYYSLNSITSRIRKEIVTENEKTFSTFLYTYKKKELKIDKDGKSIEVNDENECELNDPTPVEKFITDAGGKIKLTKHKETLFYTADTPFGQANLELCKVPPLGDFLEIEILSQSQDSETVNNIQKELHSLLLKSGIPLENIENRYYSELLLDPDKNSE
ncbi:MAG: class IV adenylate cyclase [Treponema sp.]|nr:class IV adenylate cyclase [Treponema sp.]